MEGMGRFESIRPHLWYMRGVLVIKIIGHGCCTCNLRCAMQLLQHYRGTVVCVAAADA